MKNSRRLLFLPLLLLFLGAIPGTKPVDNQVVCVLCGDYTFDEKDSAKAVYHGTPVHLCSIRELALLEKRPALVWGTDPVNGHRVNKIETKFTADRKVRVQKNGKTELWNRRFFFESAATRAAFLESPEKFTKEPYLEK